MRRFVRKTLPCDRRTVQGPRVRTVDLPANEQPRTVDRYCIYMKTVCLMHHPREKCGGWTGPVLVPDGDDDQLTLAEVRAAQEEESHDGNG